jgi:hypothetical protein
LIENIPKAPGSHIAAVELANVFYFIPISVEFQSPFVFTLWEPNI